MVVACFREGLGADGQRLRGWKGRAAGNEGSLLEIRVRVRVVQARGWRGVAVGVVGVGQKRWQ